MSVWLHRRKQPSLVAWVVPGFVASCCLLAVDAILLGHPGKLALVGVIFGTIWGILISIIVGIVMRRQVSRSETRNKDES